MSHPQNGQPPSSDPTERENQPASHSVLRRQFLATTAALSTISLVEQNAFGQAEVNPALSSAKLLDQQQFEPSLIGLYGSWAAGLAGDPPSLSYRKSEWTDIEAWRKLARDKAMELLAPPALPQAPSVQVLKQVELDGLNITHLSWQLPYGRPTQAVLLKPSGTTGRLPGVLGLHDHGGNKFFGHKKIVRTAEEPHPLIVEHQQHYYSGLAWANQLAKRGYVVLVHDTFTFASRRVMFEDMSRIPWGECKTDGRTDADAEQPENIQTYNAWAAEHEHIMSKSLFCAGTTWPGVFFAEDQVALSILAAQDAVDATRLGCAGLSGGGLRTVFLGGLDQRVKCAICVGFMSTWRDFLLNKSYTHTWMTYAPLLPRYLDFPEVLGLRAPLPTLVQNCDEDSLYTLPEMHRADEIMSNVFNKAGAPECYSGRFYPGGHKFDAQMQGDAFNWFDRWLL